jgi:hypothetical protein
LVSHIKGRAENKVLRIFGPKRGTGKGREMLSEELHKLYTLPDDIRVITSRRMRWLSM